ncbi:hypothetical protein [Lactobacillus sp. Sy-1]|uniref:hypothetical protein n=1 Tax=Lactobacillus sp. Sy-1 TaxID=2109645 RepID=UPI001C5BF9B6|nr:hypothetical protein [Lactobacillus sp. Sy-1]MBW1606167.1 hypothetical protein [Lactobacillus sp. Sy-1]
MKFFKFIRHIISQKDQMEDDLWLLLDLATGKMTEFKTGSFSDWNDYPLDLN